NWFRLLQDTGRSIYKYQENKNNRASGNRNLRGNLSGMERIIKRQIKNNITMSIITGETEFFKGIGKIQYEGKESKNPLAFRSGIGLDYYKTPAEAFINIKKIKTIEPQETEIYEGIYQEWKELLNDKLKTI